MISIKLEILNRATIIGSTGVMLLAPQFIPSVYAISEADRNSIYDQSEWYRLDSLISGGLGACGGDNINVTPGNGAPNGGQFPNLDPAKMADAINKWILSVNPNSRLKGLGSTIVASSKNSNVNPFLIVTIARKESSLSDPSDYNVSHGNNSFGRTAAPGQPSFEGARSWYYWPSVKASVDYKDPVNKNAQGGGDMATYLRTAYGSQLDNSDLTAMMMIYAPPSENDTDQYIADLKKWISELVALSGGSGDVPPDPGGGDGCGGAVIGNAVQTAINYAWPDYKGSPYCNERPSYQAAVEKAVSAGLYIGGACKTDSSIMGVDCGGFVTRVMIDSGADPNYNYGGKYADGAGNTISQKKYLDEQVGKGKYENLGNAINDTKQLQPGDIAINSGHTYMYVGSQPGFNGNSASASLGTRAPMASSAYFEHQDGPFTWYRLKN